jgi:hypothetical protein
LGPILLGHQNSDPFPNSPLFPRDLSRDRGASPQTEHSAQGGVGVVQSEGGASSAAQADNSPPGACTEGGASSSAQEDNSPQGAQASSATSSARGDNTLLGGQAGATSSAQGGDKRGDSSALGGHIGSPSVHKSEERTSSSGCAAQGDKSARGGHVTSPSARRATGQEGWRCRSSAPSARGKDDCARGGHVTSPEEIATGIAPCCVAACQAAPDNPPAPSHLIIRRLSLSLSGAGNSFLQVNFVATQSPSHSSTGVSNSAPQRTFFII